MMGKRQNMKSIEIKAGSALERLVTEQATVGVGFTQAVHKMAELFERFLEAEENAQAVIAKEPDAVVDAAGALVPNELLADLPFVEHNGQLAYNRTAPLPEPGYGAPPVDAHDVAQVLAAAREQYPSGLVPIGLDEGDDAPAEEDLSHLL